jgi:hypothetical protein
MFIKWWNLKRSLYFSGASTTGGISFETDDRPTLDKEDWGRKLILSLKPLPTNDDEVQQEKNRKYVNNGKYMHDEKMW